MMLARGLAAGLCLLALATPAAAGPCLQPAERAAFQVQALQSMLMVAALQCRQEDAYNAFVGRFRPELIGAHRAVSAHFRRAGSGMRGMDEHVTSLANAHSQDGIRQGAQFCANVAPLWRQVMALGSGADLARLSEEHRITQIHRAAACPVPARPAGQAVASAGR
jgi:hypothetical protein